MPEPSDLPAVAALLEERNALRGWLDRLDQSGASAPESVRSRVRQDYQARLDDVTGRLREHADAIAARLGADTAERDQLEQRARAAREALAEAELRHTVGEYDDQRFEDETRRHNAELEDCELALNQVMERIAHLEDVHAAVTRPAQEPAAATEFTAPAEAAPVEVVASEPPEPVGVESTDELLSIFTPVDEAPAASEPVAFEEDAIRFEEAPPSESIASEPGFGPLSFTPSDVPEAGTNPNPVRSSPPPARTPPPIGMPLPDSSPRFVRPATDRGSELVEVEEETPPVRVVPDPEPVLPELSRETEAAARTLRCGECGAMNRPLEWYCEKCGAELNSI